MFIHIDKILCHFLTGILSELPGCHFHTEFQKPGLILNVNYHAKMLFGMFLSF